MKALILAVALLAGCSNTAWSLKSGRSASHSQASLSVNDTGELAAVATIGIVAWLAYYFSTGSGELMDADTRRVPEMAPDRKVNEQDCTRPIDMSAGNIRCK
jgi:hypothetical protein